MRKLVCLLLALALSAGLSACAQPKETYRVAMLISDKGTFEGNPFHELSWAGISRYCEENDISHKWYEPEARNTEEYRKTIAQAVESGAEVIVLPGYHFEESALEAQDTYPDVSFILLDGVPNNAADGDARVERVGDNTYAVLYAEEQAGFLAGYAAVTEGYRQLGFFGGMSVPAVVRFGYGFVQGAEHAAALLNLEPRSVEIRYIYTGSFVPGPEYQTRAEYWYSQGTQVIFACGGGIGISVMSAAENSGRWVIGVDTDQSGDSPTVISSAIKQLDTSVYDAVASHYNGTFPGGQSIHLGADVAGVGLAMDTARLEHFTQADYDSIYADLATDREGLASGIRKDDAALEDIPLERVTVLQESMW